MSYLQLAENIGGVDYYSALAESPKDLYLFVPNDSSGSSGVWVREDYFDNLPIDQWQKTMIALAPYQPENQTMSAGGLLDKWRERRSAVKDTRLERKQARTENVKTGGGFGSRIMDTVSGIFGKEEQPMEQRAGVVGNLQFAGGEEPKPFYTKPAFIIGGLAVVGGIIYLATRKKK